MRDLDTDENRLADIGLIDVQDPLTSRLRHSIRIRWHLSDKTVFAACDAIAWDGVPPVKEPTT